MRNKITQERTALQSGDILTLYKHATTASQLQVRRPYEPREVEFLNFEDRNHVIDDTDRLTHLGSIEATIEFICQVTGLQAVKQESNAMYDQYVLQPGDSLFSDIINPEIYRKEFEVINEALKNHKGRRRDAAVELGISERTLYRKYQDLGKYFQFET